MQSKETNNRKPLSVILKKLTKLPRALQNFGRPKELPLYAPDCGWNHGKKALNEAPDEKEK